MNECKPEDVLRGAERKAHVAVARFAEHVGLPLEPWQMALLEPPNISWDRHVVLLACPEYQAWNAGLSPALARVVRMVPRNEGLTHWTVTKLADSPLVRRGLDIVAYEVGLVTPPAEAEWLDPGWWPA